MLTHAHEVHPTFQGIWLGGNLLTRLPQNIGDFPALNTLSAPGNVLSDVPEALERLTTLQQLVLSGNQLTALPSGISALGASQDRRRNFSGSLRKLEVTGGMLQAMPDNVTGLDVLTQPALCCALACTIPCPHVSAAHPLTSAAAQAACASWS